MRMRYQLREYDVRPGEMEEWVADWEAKIRPLRINHGFEVVGAWVVEGESRFVWILGHEDFEVADARYYESEERRSMTPDPARHLSGNRATFMTRVSGS
ncbi:MAG: NIPSNAP family containing protein [Chloroflexi bacterium]|nr:MAG: NIPSNAP family containing protein [Chloroflexota bacterium]TME19559.1 MAG: NIPSNAP family containing protein [Chloroflexota bacterium]